MNEKVEYTYVSTGTDVSPEALSSGRADTIGSALDKAFGKAPDGKTYRSVDIIAMTEYADVSVWGVFDGKNTCSTFKTLKAGEELKGLVALECARASEVFHVEVKRNACKLDQLRNMQDSYKFK